MRPRTAKLTVTIMDSLQVKIFARVLTVTSVTISFETEIAIFTMPTPDVCINYYIDEILENIP